MNEKEKRKRLRTFIKCIYLANSNADPESVQACCITKAWILLKALPAWAQEVKLKSSTAEVYVKHSTSTTKPQTCVSSV